MAKSTHSSEALTGTSGSFTEHELNDPDPVVIRRPELGRVDWSEEKRLAEEEAPSQPNQEDGTDSSPSSQSEQSSSESSTQDPHSPAPMTESPSKAPETETDSSASSTDTDGLSKPQTPSSRRRNVPAKKAAPAANTKQARVRSTDDEFGDEF